MLRNHPFKFLYYGDGAAVAVDACRELEGLVVRWLGAPEPAVGAQTNWVIVNPQEVPDLRLLANHLQHPLLLPTWFSRCDSAGRFLLPRVDLGDIVFPAGAQGASLVCIAGCAAISLNVSTCAGQVALAGHH